MNDAELKRRTAQASGPPPIGDFVTFLRKRLAEDRQRALDTLPLRPTQERWAVREVPGLRRDHAWHITHLNGSITVAKNLNEDTARYIAHQDPRRIDLEIAHKLAVLDELEAAAARGKPQGYVNGLLFVVRQMALVYADHPDYKENWRP